MTVQELVDWCNANNVPLDTQMAVRAKDDYFVTEESLHKDKNPYFGNCRYGDEWLDENAPRDEHGDIDYDNLPPFLIIDTDCG